MLILFHVPTVCVWSCNTKVQKCKRNLKSSEPGNDSIWIKELVLIKPKICKPLESRNCLMPSFGDLHSTDKLAFKQWKGSSK